MTALREGVWLAVIVGCALLLSWLGFLASRAADLPINTPSAVMPARSFNDLERLPDQRWFRWTIGQSRLGVPNPGGEARLRLRLLDGPTGRTPLTVTGPSSAARFELLPGLRRYEFLLPPSDRARLDLMLSSPTAQVSRRTLGVGVTDVRIAGGGEVPLRGALALLAASLGAYALMRRAAVPPLGAASVTLALQALVALFLHLGGWQFGFTSQALLAAGGAALLAALLDYRQSATDRRPTTDYGSPSSLVARPSSLVVPVALLLLALAVRLPWLLAPDPTGDLELAARRMFYLYDVGLPGAYLRGGDYMPLRLYLLWGLAQVVGAAGVTFVEPIAPLTKLLVKLPQLTADLATVLVIYAWGLRWAQPRAAALVAAVYTCAPPVWINSAWWGQVDALLMLPMIGAVLLLDRGEGRWAWVCWALALLIKTQAIILAPVLYIATLRRHGSASLLRGASLAALVFAAGCAPLIAAGQGFGLAEAYLGAVGRFPRTTYGAYNLWQLALGGLVVNDVDAAIGPLSYRQLGLVLLGAAALLVCAALWRRSDGPGRVEASAALALAFFTLPTQMHSRYLFLSLAFVALAACVDRRLLVLFLVLAASATINILGILSGFWPAAKSFIDSSPLPFICAVLNLLVLGVLLVRLLPRDRSGARPPGS